MKPAQEIKNKATSLFKTMPEIQELYVNDKGEFFTSENLASNSVDTTASYRLMKRSEVIERVKKEKLKEKKDETTQNTNNR